MALSTLELERLPTARGMMALALPMAASLGVGFFLHFMNRLFLAWHSPEAIAASYPAGMLAWAAQSFFALSASYVGTFAAQHHGAGEDEEAGAMCWPALWLGLFATILSLALIPARHALVGLFGLRDPAVASYMAELFAWYLAETGPLTVMSAMSAFYAGLGRTRVVLMISVLGCVISIALNYWLIFGGAGVPALGITGAGLATLIASLLFLGVWTAMFFRRELRQQFATWRGRNADPRRFLRFLRFAIPRGASEVLEMVAFLIFSAAITPLPTTAVAASNIAFSLYLLLLVPFVGLGQGIAIAVGQCMGAGRSDLARRVGWMSLRLGLPVLIGIALAFWFLPRQLLAIYAVSTADASAAATWAETLELAVPVLAWLGIAAIGEGCHWIFRMVIVGAGDTRWTLLAMVSTALLTLSLPVWWLLRIADPALLAGWNISPLTASYGVFAVYCWCICTVLFLRFQYGPWPRMSVRG